MDHHKASTDSLSRNPLLTYNNEYSPVKQELWLKPQRMDVETKPTNLDPFKKYLADIYERVMQDEIAQTLKSKDGKARVENASETMEMRKYYFARIQEIMTNEII